MGASFVDCCGWFCFVEGAFVLSIVFFCLFVCFSFYYCLLIFFSKKTAGDYLARPMSEFKTSPSPNTGESEYQSDLSQQKKLEYLSPDLRRAVCLAVNKLYTFIFRTKKHFSRDRVRKLPVA